MPGLRFTGSAAVKRLLGAATAAGGDSGLATLPDGEQPHILIGASPPPPPAASQRYAWASASPWPLASMWPQQAQIPPPKHCVASGPPPP